MKSKDRRREVDGSCVFWGGFLTTVEGWEGEIGQK
jgi:hypothetical protein